MRGGFESAVASAFLGHAPQWGQGKALKVLCAHTASFVDYGDGDWRSTVDEPPALVDRLMGAHTGVLFV